MTHRDDCPSRWDAEREGRRAAADDRGRWGNPYREHSFDDGCREAERSWDDGYRREQAYREDIANEERAAERAEERRRAAQDDELDRMWEAQIQRQYEEWCEQDYWEHRRSFEARGPVRRRRRKRQARYRRGLERIRPRQRASP